MTCVWCGKKSKKIFHARVRWKNLSSTWYRCASCGSLMMSPRPSQREIKKFYESGYRNKIQAHGIDYRLRYSKKYQPTVFNGYLLSLIDVGISKAHLDSVLDFGCADGSFLEFAKKYFGQKTVLYGTDVSDEMMDVARKRGLNVSPLHALESLGRKFDIIILWDVIEHIENPKKVIALLKKMLTPKGRIVIQTPRVGELAYALSENWEHLLPLQHINLASKNGMEQFAKRMRLEIILHKSFGANAPASAVKKPFKNVFDQLAKKLDFGSEQVLSLRKKKD